MEIDSEILLEWSDLEFDYRPKSTYWFQKVLGAGVIVVIISILLGNILFAVFIGIGTFVLLMIGSQKPKHESYAITKRGIRIGEKIHVFSTLESFWIREEEKPYKFVIKARGTFSPPIILPLGVIDPDEIREHLQGRLRETPRDKELLESISEYIGI
tara:strand:- start:6619 stop:7089 length:471 start_codon:yes stop_codon:yes gene_type:complete